MCCTPHWWYACHRSAGKWALAEGMHKLPRCSALFSKDARPQLGHCIIVFQTAAEEWHMVAKSTTSLACSLFCSVSTGRGRISRYFRLFPFHLHDRSRPTRGSTPRSNFPEASGSRLLCSAARSSLSALKLTLCVRLKRRYINRHVCFLFLFSCFLLNHHPLKSTCPYLPR